MMDGLKSEHVYEKLEEIFEGVNILSFLKASREEKEKMSMSAMEAELNGIIAYINQINQFIGFEVKGGEAPYIGNSPQHCSKKLAELLREARPKEKMRRAVEAM